MKVVLELQDQPSNVRRVTVRHDIVIGRGSDCNLRLSAPQVSRRHCFLRVGREGVSVTDLDSSNGTYVDGKRIKPGKRFELIGGSSLSVGPIKFVVQIKEDAVSPDILKTNNLSDSQLEESSDQGTGGSNVPGVAGTLEALRSDDDDRPMSLAVERAGDAADSHDPTDELKDDADFQQRSVAPAYRQKPELLDSRAEIIDLGRRIAQLDAQAAADHADAVTVRPETPADGSNQLTTSSDNLVLGDLDLLEVIEDEDLIEIVDEPELLEAVAVEEVVEFEELAEPEIVEVIDDVPEAAVEAIEELSEADVEVVPDSGSSWFDSPSDAPDEKDETDDPDLRKFLKGF